MPRITLLALFLAAALFGGRAAKTVRAQPLMTYDAGWNLVSGPQGSHVAGASGSLYTVQPGDSTYRTLPVTTALTAGWGYWAYFAAAGSLDTAGSSESLMYTVAPRGAYVMVGNPSFAVASILAADVSYTYTPSGGYRRSDTLTPGNGAWAFAGGEVTVTAAPTFRPLQVVQSQDLGAVLADFQGRTVYARRADAPGQVSCTGACAEVWPPVRPPAGNPTLPPGVPGSLGVATRDDGSPQLTYNDRALSTYSGDMQQGDVRGQGVGGFTAVTPAAR